MKFKYLPFYFLIIVSSISCINKKKIIYFQGSEAITNNYQAVNYNNRIQPNDILDINISSQNPEAAAPFNQQLVLGSMQSGSMQAQEERASGRESERRGNYLVNNTGNVEFPILGSIKVAGLTREEFIVMLKEKLKPFVSDAVVYMSIVNFRVSVLGEVTKPGVISVTGDRISLLEAIAQTGDLTLFGKRDNVLIVRDEMGVKTFNRIDLTQAEFINSPFYYLKQNDVVYVEPRKVKIDSTAIGSNVTAAVSIVGLLITTTFLLFRL